MGKKKCHAIYIDIEVTDIGLLFFLIFIILKVVSKINP